MVIASKKKRRKGLKSVIFCVLLILVLVWTFFPFYWTISTSFKKEAEYFSFPPIWLPGELCLKNYELIFFGGRLEASEIGSGISITVNKPLLNTLVVGFGSTIISVVLASFAAFALSRFLFKGRETIAFWILSLRALPPIAIIIPYFFLMKTYKLLDTRVALIITYTVFNLPIAVWLLMRYFEDIPRDLEDAALVDGCSRFSCFWRILLPIALPGIIAVTIFCLVFAWNEFMFASILTRHRAMTIPVVISKFVMQKGILFGPIGATIAVATIPILVAALMVQKHMVRIMTLGAIKG